MKGATKPELHGTTTHRLDIDGLRAIAVLPVVAYHVGIRAIPGGFVGVDIFFVISGFLITQVLLLDVHRNQFSLARFYERRVRRLLPALIPLMAVTSLVSLIYSLPGELIDFSKSLIATALSISNFYFWKTGGYFTAPALTRPLLHTWSLAVEEQFYALWPLYLWFGIHRLERHLLTVTFGIIGTSLAMSVIGAFAYPSATFYLVHTRAWELLLGSVLPLGAFPRPLGEMARNTMSAAGLLMIIGSSLLIHSDMPFPGLLAVPPCLGAFFIILSGRDGDSLCGRLLSWRPVVFIGLISYSLYLWHWPLTVFQRNYAILMTGGSDKSRKLLIIAVSLILASLSWRFIEQPFRFGASRPARRPLFIMAGVGTTVVVLLGVAGWAMHGFPYRYSARDLEIAAVMSFDSRKTYRTHSCFLLIPEKENFADDCLQPAPSRHNVLLLGDSHAAELWFGLHTAFPDVNFLQASAVNCFPVVDHGIGEASACVRAIDHVLRMYVPTHKIDMVILAARWKADYVSRIGETLQWLHSQRIPVTLFGPTPVYDSPLPRLIVTANRTGDSDLIARSWDHTLIGLDETLAKLAVMYEANYISPIRILCNGYRCATRDDHGLPLLFDEEHFTANGSILFARRLKANKPWGWD